MKKQNAAFLSIISNSFLIIFKSLLAYDGLHTVISEAAHSGIDLIASIVAFFSIKRPSSLPTGTPYGPANTKTFRAFSSNAHIFRRGNDHL